MPSDLDSVAEIERAVEAMASGWASMKTASNIAMVTREAAINACKHGNRFAKDKFVDATVDRIGRDADRSASRIRAKASIRRRLPDPLDPTNLLRSSGRGVFLMRAIMDEVHFRQLQPGTQVTLIKHRHSEANS